MTKSGNRFLSLNHATMLERDDKKWEPVFVPKSRDNKNLERTFYAIKCHPALVPPVVSKARTRALTLICLETVIGRGRPQTGSSRESHRPARLLAWRVNRRAD